MDIFKYKEELEQKLEAVNKVIADMGEEAPKRRGRPAKAGAAPAPTAKRGRRKMSAAAKAMLSAAAKARWKKAKAAGKSRL